MAKVNKTAESSFIQLDGKDIELLKLLQDNARMTVKEIADKVNLTPTPVHERIKRLEESGVIKQYAALINSSKVGKGLTVICYVSLKEHSKAAGAKFIKAINALNEIVECYNISGEFDFMMKVISENMETYYDFHVNKLSQIENMGQVQSIFVMGVIKQTHRVIY